MKAALFFVALIAASTAAPLAVSAPKNAGCDWCKIGFSVLEDLVSMNITEQYIEFALGYFCNFIPAPYDATCHSIVDADIEELIAMVKAIENPEEICCQVGACTDNCPDIDVGCSICKYLMTDLERWISEGKTVEEIEKLIEGICTILPDSAQAVCKSIADLGVQTLIDLLLKYETPKVVCEQITLCNASDPNAKAKAPVAPKPAFVMQQSNDAGCDWCQIGFSVLEDLVSMNATEKYIEWALTQICNLMPDPYKTACKEVIDTDFEEIIRMIDTIENPKEICCQVGACKDDCPAINVGCSMCKYLISDLDRWLDEGKGTEEIEHLIDNICLLLPSGAQGVCKRIADIGVENLIQLLLKYETPEAVCYQITLCPNETSVAAPSAARKVAKLLSKHKLPAAGVKSAGCDWCKIGFSIIEDLLALNETDTYIKIGIEYVCTLMPEPYESACKDVVDSDFEEILNILRNVENPEEICCQVGACSEPCPVVDVPCTMCKYVIGDVDRWLKEGKGTKDIEVLISSICLLMPESAQPVCDKIFDIGVEEVIQVLLKYETPEVACHEMTLCNETNAKAAALIAKIAAMDPREMVKGAGCDWCKIGFSVLEDLLSLNTTEYWIEYGLSYFCNLMPDPYKTACKEVVDADIEELIEMVKEIENPQEICCQVGACTDSCPVIDVPCAMCKYILTDIDRWLKEGKGTEEIEHLIDSICLLLPESAQPVCKTIADVGVDEVIQVLLKYETPAVACHEMTLCNTTSVVF